MPNGSHQACALSSKALEISAQLNSAVQAGLSPLVPRQTACVSMHSLQCKPGVMYREIGQVVSAVADKFGCALFSAVERQSSVGASAGLQLQVQTRESLKLINIFLACECRLSVVRSYCGHGIGELFHAAPSVPHYRNNKAVRVQRGCLHCAHRQTAPRVWKKASTLSF